MGMITSSMKETQQQMMLGQREVMMASQIGKLRDDFRWMCAFHGTIMSGSLIAATVRRQPQLLAPWLPMGISLAYTYDLAYGNKFERIQLNAEQVLREERHRLALPQGTNMMTRDDYIARFVAPHYKAAAQMAVAGVPLEAQHAEARAAEAATAHYKPREPPLVSRFILGLGDTYVATANAVTDRPPQ